MRVQTAQCQYLRTECRIFPPMIASLIQEVKERFDDQQ